jgi:hypothetical protein
MMGEPFAAPSPVMLRPGVGAARSDPSRLAAMPSRTGRRVRKSATFTHLTASRARNLARTGVGTQLGDPPVA